jgi:hypothetical protein
MYIRVLDKKPSNFGSLKCEFLFIVMKLLSGKLGLLDGYIQAVLGKSLRGHPGYRFAG